MSLLRVENVSKNFGSLIAVNDVSMTVEPGELRAIIGPNGAGKTTFFNMISGFLTQSSGKIIFADEDISSLLPARRVWLGIARTFQITEVFPELSVRENLRTAVEVAAGYRLSPWLAKDGDGEIRARVTDLLDMSGLAEKADRLVGELAHGDQRATEIMMALALKPRLLLLDEPTAGMGDQETYDITRLIRKLHRDQKLTIVLIEHDMRVVFHLADRIMVLAEGKMLAEGTPQDIAANEAVQAAYLGKAAHEQRGARGGRPPYLLRQESHPPWRRAGGARGRDRRAVGTQRRRQDHHAAQPDGADACARRRGAHLRSCHHRLAGLSHRCAGRRLCARGPAHLRQLDGRGKSQSAARTAGAVDDRSHLRTFSAPRPAQD